MQEMLTTEVESHLLKKGQETVIGSTLKMADKGFLFKGKPRLFYLLVLFF